MSRFPLFCGASVLGWGACLITLFPGGNHWNASKSWTPFPWFLWRLSHHGFHGQVQGLLGRLVGVSCVSSGGRLLSTRGPMRIRTIWFVISVVPHTSSALFDVHLANMTATTWNQQKIFALVSASDLAADCVHATSREDDDKRKAISMC